MRTHRFVERTDPVGMSLSDMHYRLGQYVEVGGKVYSDGKTFDANKRCFDCLSLDCWPVTPQPTPPPFNRAFADRLQAKWDAEGDAYDKHWPDRAAYEAALAEIDEQFGDVS